MDEEKKEEQQPATLPSEGEDPLQTADKEKETQVLDEGRLLLEEKEKQIQALNDRYLRLYAEFENYKKKVARDQAEYRLFSHEQLLKEVLPVLDNIERALFHVRATANFEKMVEGLVLIQKQFLGAIERFGVRVIESKKGEAFDPSLQQAVSRVESDTYPENSVVEEVQKGYLLYDRVLRPSLVTVAQRKEQAQGETPGLSGSEEEGAQEA